MRTSGGDSACSDASTTASITTSIDTADEESGFMINVLTEDAVNTACLGFDHQSFQSKLSSGANGEHFATLILNIEDAQSPDWLFSIASGSVNLGKILFHCGQHANVVCSMSRPHPTL